MPSQSQGVRFTHNAVLNTEAELELEIRSLDEDSGDRRAAYNTQLHLHLILQTLGHIKTRITTSPLPASQATRGMILVYSIESGPKEK